MRPADTAARGTNTNRKTAISTENRICMRYCRKAVRFPIDIAPLSTRMAPNHIVATVERLRIRVITGMVTANRRLTRMRRVEQVEARLVEPAFLVFGPDERPDDPNAGERLAHDLVDPVELHLHRAEERDRPAHDQADEARPSSAG